MGNLLILLVAICGTEFIHNCFEIWGIRQKVDWLDSAQNSLQHSKWPMNINTKLVALAFHTIMLLLISGILFIFLKVFDLSDRNLILVGIIILVTNYATTTWFVDGYHSQIGKLITKAKQKN